MTICRPGVPPNSTLVKIGEPAADPVSIGDAKLWLRVGSDREIDTIGALIKAAVGKLDGPTGILNPSRCLAKQTWQLNMAGFPAAELALPLVPAVSISAVTYLDSNGAEQTMDAAGYALSGDEWSATLVLAAGASWPSSSVGSDSARIKFVAGYDQLPPMLRQDVLTLVGYWFDNRTMAGQLPPGWTSIYRRPVLA
jgi:uncharacterized phiE125 gp8 family phage protein